MLKVQATTNLIQWAFRLKTLVNHSLSEDGALEIDEFVSPIQPFQFAAGTDESSPDKVVRLWCKMENGHGMEWWFAEAGAMDAMDCHSAEALDGEDDCKYTHSHTRAFCGRSTCRKS